jgi:hypothetical protein
MREIISGKELRTQGQVVVNIEFTKVQEVGR